MKDRPKRSSTSLNNSYTEHKLDDFDDPITSDDQFADPMYVMEDVSESSEESSYTSKTPKKPRKNVIAERKSILEETYSIKKRDMEKAIEEINNRGRRKTYLLNYDKTKKSKIKDLCSRDPKIRSRNTIGGCLTRTQQILYQLNKSVLKHDWSAVATLIDYMLNLNGKILPAIWKSLFLVLFNHPESSAEKIDNFLQMCIGLRTEPEKNQYLEEIFSLPEDFTKFVKPGSKKVTNNVLEDTEIRIL